MLSHVQELLTKIKPFEALPLKGGFNIGKAKMLATLLGIDVGEGLVTKLAVCVTEVHKDLSSNPESVTVGRVVAHPLLQKFLKELPPPPDFRVMKCPGCGRVMERNIHSPAPCHACGFTWKSDTEQIQAQA